ncbi:MAG: hypothetical protein ABJN26_18670 [Stappiaceae bacterium]
MRRLGLILGFLVCLVLVPLEAYATSCWRPSPAEHIEQSDVIFYGEVLQTRKQFKQDKHIKIATFKVIQAYKGVRSKKIDVGLYVIGSGEANIPFHKPMMIFAHFVDDKILGRKIVATGTCSLVPYEIRKKHHPEYWELLIAMSKENKTVQDER